MRSLAALARATEHLEPPYAVVDLDAFDRNAETLVRRSAGTPVRLATKSVRSRDLIERVLARPGYRGLLAFTLAEGLWLADLSDDVLVGYPTSDRSALRELAADEVAAARVTLMVDSVAHLDWIEQTLGATPGPRIRVCIDLDASLRLLGGRLHLGMRRSPVHTADDAVELARAIADRPRLTLVGLMSYEGHIAGLPDNSGSLLHRASMRVFQTLSAEELRHRRARVVAAVREVADLEFVNGGGTGSLERTSAEPAITDVAAGSGLFGPALFDHYSAFRPEPAAYFALSVVRRPGPRHATLLGGGWVASGAPGRDRLPVPVWPEGLELLPTEGAGEVQTPVTGPGADQLTVGDRVWLRHAKAGELCEHVEMLWLVQQGSIVGKAATYRGEGRAFL